MSFFHHYLVFHDNFHLLSYSQGGWTSDEKHNIITTQAEQNTGSLKPWFSTRVRVRRPQQTSKGLWW